jgi:RHH-type rel operon transcriptional repressor/antitoxin RelB
MGDTAMTYSIRLPLEIENRLESLSIQTGRTKSFYVKKAIIEHLDQIEDTYLSEQRLEDIRAGKTQTLSLQEVMKFYDMDWHPAKYSGLLFTKLNFWKQLIHAQLKKIKFSLL